MLKMGLQSKEGRGENLQTSLSHALISSQTQAEADGKELRDLTLRSWGRAEKGEDNGGREGTEITRKPEIAAFRSSLSFNCFYGNWSITSLLRYVAVMLSSTFYGVFT